MWGLPQRQGSIHWSTFGGPVNSQNKEKLAQYAVSPAHECSGSQDEVKLAYQQLCMPYARTLAHVRGGSQDEEKILLLPPFTPRPYLGQRYYHIVYVFQQQEQYSGIQEQYYYINFLGVRGAASYPRLCYYSLLSGLWLNFKISPTKVDGEWWN